MTVLLLFALLNTEFGLAFPFSGLSNGVNIGKYSIVAKDVYSADKINSSFFLLGMRLPPITGQLPVYMAGIGPMVKSPLSMVGIKVSLGFGFGAVNVNNILPSFVILPHVRKRLFSDLPFSITLSSLLFFPYGYRYIMTLNIGFYADL